MEKFTEKWAEKFGFEVEYLEALNKTSPPFITFYSEHGQRFEIHINSWHGRCGLHAYHGNFGPSFKEVYTPELLRFDTVEEFKTIYYLLLGKQPIIHKQ